ncbi:hypothetical protein QBC37DRAFT_461899 [Rhypophila decipiens]|uniref:Uncharacterized protein n=1 Tax=Rhypophila decipiens TaxID=261697 RepID=A0AAN7B867_9PEZI|nr:hypothetical protein QBC37DRAFT_461899 [Rhypophila decipiens]
MKYTTFNKVAASMVGIPVALFSLLVLHTAARQTADANLSACLTIGAIVTVCQSYHPNLLTITAFQSAASCACYSSGIWAPSIFDANLAACANYYSTANTSNLAAISNFYHTTAPCELAGNVLNASATATATTVDQPTGAGPSACSYLSSVIFSCSSVSPDFATQTNPHIFASCLCYGPAGIDGVLTGWKPMAFDNALATCNSYLSSVNPGAWASYTTQSNAFLRTPCASAGDVKNSGSSSTVPRTSVGASTATATSTTTSSAAMRSRLEVGSAGGWLLGSGLALLMMNGV